MRDDLVIVKLEEIDQLLNVIKTFHQNCDPMDMTYEDHLVWEEWNKKLHPENYNDC